MQGETTYRCGRNRVLWLTLTLAISANASAQTTARRIWSGDEIGSARQIALALDEHHVYLAETGRVTTLDRATGRVVETRVETRDGDYLPVQAIAVHEGALWLSVGNGTRRSRPRLLRFDGVHTREVARLEQWACSLASSEGELFFSDRQHILSASGGRVRTVVTAPAGRYFATDCRVPLAFDRERLYVVLGTASDPRAPTPLLAYPRHGGASTVLDADVALRRPMLAGGALVLTYTSGSVRPIERFDLATRVRTTIVASATVGPAAVVGGDLTWIDGNFFSHDPWAVRRVTVSTGVVVTLHQGDQRLGHALVADEHGTFALVGAHPAGECVTHHPMEPGDHEITRCSQPDLQLFEVTGR